MKRNIIKKIGTAILTSVTLFSLGSRFNVFAGGYDGLKKYFADKAEQNLKGKGGAIEGLKIDIDDLYERIVKGGEEVDEDLKRKIREVKKVVNVLWDDDENPGINQNISKINAWYKEINGKSEDFENEENSNITSYNDGVSNFENYDGEEKAYLLKVRLFEDGSEENIIIRKMNKRIEKLNEKINGYKYFTIDELGKRIDDLYVCIVVNGEEVNEEVKKEIRDLKDMLFLQNRRIKGCVYHDNKRKNITRSEEYSKINSYNIGISSWVKSCNDEERVYLLKINLVEDDREENDIIRDINEKVEKINYKVNGYEYKYFTIDELGKRIDDLYACIVANGEEVNEEVKKEIRDLKDMIFHQNCRVIGPVNRNECKNIIESEEDKKINYYNKGISNLVKSCNNEERVYLLKFGLFKDDREENAIIRDINEKVEKINYKVNGYEYKYFTIDELGKMIDDLYACIVVNGEEVNEEVKKEIRDLKDMIFHQNRVINRVNCKKCKNIIKSKEDKTINPYNRGVCKFGRLYDEEGEKVYLLKFGLFKDDRKENKIIEDMNEKIEKINEKVNGFKFNEKEEFKGMKRHQAQELPTKQEMSRRFESQIEMNRRFESQIEKGNNSFNIGKQPEMKEMKEIKEIKEIKEKKGMKKLSKVSEKKKVKRVEVTEEDDSKEEIIDVLAKKREKERKEMEEE